MARVRERHWLKPALLAVLLFQSSCALLPQPDVLPPAEPLHCPPPSDQARIGGREYQIERAVLVIHTYRAGWLSSLAHNHVIETDVLQGGIRIGDPVDTSTARLCFRPWDLELDNAESRAAAGAGFESERDAADIAATRTRMLGPAGFHSNRYPVVRADVRWRDSRSAVVTIRFRDASIPIEVPLVWQRSHDGIQLTADFELSHRSLAIRPYSAFAGAIAVADPIRVQLRLSARAASSL